MPVLDDVSRARIERFLQGLVNGFDQNGTFIRALSVGLPVKISITVGDDEPTEVEIVPMRTEPLE